MDSKLRITELLIKHKVGSISYREMEELYAMMNEENRGEIEELISSEWDKTSLVSDEVDSSFVLGSVRRRLGLKEDIDFKRYYRTKKQLYWTIARYAAVFAVAFGLAWIFRKEIPIQPVKSEFCKVIVANGSKSTIQLPDSSIVHLNSGSTLIYPSGFTGSDRIVTLEGEAYFEVKKDHRHPFYVRTSEITVKVLGTKFNVRAYPDEKTIETTLVSGAVDIIEKGKKESEAISLKPNQKAVCKRYYPLEYLQTNTPLPVNHKKEIKLPVVIQKEVKTDIYTAWTNNVLVINNEPFNEIVRKLERWYDVEITLDAKSLLYSRFSGKFDRESIQEVLDVLRLIQPFRYTISKNKIIITAN